WRADRVYGTSVDRGSPDVKSRSDQFALKPVPNHTRRMKDFNGSNCSRSIAIIQKDDCYIEQTVTAFCAGYLPLAAVCLKIRLLSHGRLPLCWLRLAPINPPPHRLNPG